MRLPRRRLAVLVVAGLAILAAGLAYRQWWLVWPVGEGPAGPPVPRGPFREVWSTRKVLLLGLGDSVTAGFGAARGCGYFDRLARNPRGEFAQMQSVSLSAVFPDLETRNLAVSGSNSLDHLEAVEGLEVQDPETLGIVVMTTGGNDLIHWYGRMPPREGALYGATLDQARPWIADFDRRFNRMLDLLDERFPGGCQAFVADIYDPTDGLGDAHRVGLPRWPDGLAIHRAYNETIRRAAAGRPNVHVVPMRDAFLGHGIHCRQFWRGSYRSEDPHYWYGAILEDPNERGYDAIRRLFLLELLKARHVFHERAAMVRSRDRIAYAFRRRADFSPPTKYGAD